MDQTTNSTASPNVLLGKEFEENGINSIKGSEVFNKDEANAQIQEVAEITGFSADSLTTNSTASLNVLFGKEFEGNGINFAKGSAVFNKDEANAQIQEVAEITGFSVDSLALSTVVGFYVPEDKKPEFMKFYERITGEAEYNSEYHYEFCERGLQKKNIQLNLQDKGEIIYLQLINGEKKSNYIKKIYDQIEEYGINGLEQHKSTIDILLASEKSIQECITQLEEEEKIGIVPLDSIKLIAKLNIQKEQLQKSLKICEKFKDEDDIFGIICQFSLFATSYQDISIDLRFESPAEISKFLRQRTFFGVDFQDLIVGKEQRGSRSVTKNDIFFQQVMENFSTKIVVYGQVKDFVAIRAECQAPDLTKLIKRTQF